MSVRVELTYRDVPPSYNTYQRAHWRKQARLKKEWQQVFESLLLASRAGRGPWKRVEAKARLRFKDHRRRDEGNFRVPIEKALGDALVNGSWIPDDTFNFFQMREVEFEPETGDPRIVVTLTFFPHE
jgi:hypothetical protein